jgi:hypothetical protein
MGLASSFGNLIDPRLWLERRSSLNFHVERDMSYVFSSPSTDVCVRPPFRKVTGYGSLGRESPVLTAL